MFFLTHAILQKWVVLQWSPETLILSRNNAFFALFGTNGNKMYPALTLVTLENSVESSHHRLFILDLTL